VPFTPGRTDASQEQTDVDSFAVLEPKADGFRNYVRKGLKAPAAELLVDKAQAADADRAGDDGAGRRPARAGRQCRPVAHGVFTQRPETLSNDFFVNLLDMHQWKSLGRPPTRRRAGRPRPQDGELKWTGTVVDLVFGSNSQLRALAEVYASSDAQQKFVRDFVAAWTKVMNLRSLRPGAIADTLGLAHTVELL
jgi:catalase-peroxidase